ncbi:MAG: hypothetical protein ABSF55_03065 [Candidatus Staskawiczbacteria bacterium]|jgi:hypothetical protein
MTDEFEELKKEVSEEALSKELAKAKIEKKKTELLIDLAHENDAELFYDQYKDAFILLNINGQNKILKVRSGEFKKWLAHQFWKNRGEAASNDVLGNAINTLEGEALYGQESKMHRLSIRITEHENRIWFDLGNAKAVCIDKTGWKIIENPPILFRQLNHQENQVEPKKSGNILQVLEFLNLKPSENPEKISEQQLLFIVSLVSKFIPGFPHPIDVFHGAQGSGKTTASKIVKELADPSIIKSLALSKDLREFVQTCSHHWFIALDNINSLSNELSDALCRVITGSGFSKRELFSDDSDIIYNFMHCIAINGINLAPQKADLLDRCLILELERIKKFRDEKKFWGKFKETKAELLGAIFDIVVKALGHIDSAPNCEFMRLQDFGQWGCAISLALGYSAEDFLTAFKNNVALQNREALDSSSVAQAIILFMENRDEWRGTSDQLLVELNRVANQIASDAAIDTRSKYWPKNHHWLWRKAEEVVTNLEVYGIRMWRERTSKERLICIEKTVPTPEKDKNAVSAVIPKNTENKAEDGEIDVSKMF